MSKRKPTAASRSVRPIAEGLETRQLLSAINSAVPKGSPTMRATAVVNGTDPSGARWTLRLFGPGTLNVVGTNGDVFLRSTANLSEEIDTITVAGAISTETRLVGKVIPSASTGSDRVHFQNLIVTPTGELGKIDAAQVSNFRTTQNGILAIDMPNFFMAHTEITKPSTASQIHTSAMSAGEIFIPQGVNTLRFGGVDVNFKPANGVALNTTSQSNEFQIFLGLPVIQGTSVIVDTVNSNAQANSSATSPPFQNYATFLVTGRLNLFQANEIDGVTTPGLVPTQLVNMASTTGLSPGGTYVVSQGGPATGQIGNVRIGGNVTNFTTFITEDPVNVVNAEGQLDAKISNFYIGGQTKNVLLVAPSGSRNISFGLGMDNVTINSLAISSLRANRDALNSFVTVSRSIGNLLIGGDVENTSVNVGEAQSLFAFASTPPSNPFASGTGVFFGQPPPTLINPQRNPATSQAEPFAQNGGTMKARIAGSVINSVFSASVDPDPTGLTGNGFGTIQDLILPRGVINAKVEGNINNVNNPFVDSASTGRAFFARTVHLFHGPIIPPVVPYPPLSVPTVYHTGQSGLKGLIKVDHVPVIIGGKATRTHKKKK
jgi:hypothetical protein